MSLSQLISALFMICLPMFMSAQQEQAMPYGIWVVVNPPDSLASPEIMRSVNPYLGKKIVLKEKKFKSFFRRSGRPPFTLKTGKCKAPLYEWDTHGAEEFYLQSGEAIVLYDQSQPTEIPVLSVLCPGPDGETGATLYQLREDWLLLSYLGLNCYLQRK